MIEQLQQAKNEYLRLPLLRIKYERRMLFIMSIDKPFKKKRTTYCSATRRNVIEGIMTDVKKRVKGRGGIEQITSIRGINVMSIN